MFIGTPTPPTPRPHFEISEDMPCYRISNKSGFLDDRQKLWNEGDILYWEGEPNLYMDPLNELAELKLRELCDKLIKLAEQVKKDRGEQYYATVCTVGTISAKQKLEELDKAMDYDFDKPDAPLFLKKQTSLAKSVYDYRPAPKQSNTRPKKKENV